MGFFPAWTTSVLGARWTTRGPPGDLGDQTRSWRPEHSKSLNSRACGRSSQAGMCSCLAASAKSGSSLGAERDSSQTRQEIVSSYCSIKHLLSTITSPPCPLLLPVPGLFCPHRLLQSSQHSSSGSAQAQNLQSEPLSLASQAIHSSLLASPTSCCNISPSPPLPEQLAHPCNRAGPHI